jgi:hypothetical protein
MAHVLRLPLTLHAQALNFALQVLGLKPQPPAQQQAQQARRAAGATRR